MACILDYVVPGTEHISSIFLASILTYAVFRTVGYTLTLLKALWPK